MAQTYETSDAYRGGRLQIARTRGAVSGLALLILGAWGAVIPFIGSYFSFGYSLDHQWTAGRGWLEVAPGAVAFLAGLLLIATTSRFTAMIGSWLAVAAGAWFVVGGPLNGLTGLGDIGAPTGSSDGLRALETLLYFYALGAAIVFFGALSLGRISVRSVRDVRGAQRREAREAERTAMVDSMTASTVPGAATSGTAASPTTNGSPVEQNDHSHRHFRRGARHEQNSADTLERSDT